MSSDEQWWLMNMVGGQEWAYARMLCTLLPDRDRKGLHYTLLQAAVCCCYHFVY